MTKGKNSPQDATDNMELIVYKDTFNGTRAPWRGDLKFSDGKCWKAWQTGFTSKAKLIQNAEAAFSSAQSESYTILRGQDCIC